MSMLFHYTVLSLLLFVNGTRGEQGRLFRCLDALEKVLLYMQRQVAELHLDAVSGMRFVEEHIRALLLFKFDLPESIRQRLMTLQDVAKAVADEGRTLYSIKDPLYAAELGFLMNSSSSLMWYPSRSTSLVFVEEPVDCDRDIFNGHRSDFCFSELFHNGGTEFSRCGVSEGCVLAETEGNQRGYSLTHQVLYWQMMEKWQCINAGGMENLQMRLCSNVMRDVNLTAAANYPLSHRDLFMEQIAFCGAWGFADFYRSELAEKILEWQNPSGCYADYGEYNCMESDMYRHVDGKVRVKRTEKMLSDGCMAHKTTVAMFALAVMIRYEADETKKQIEREWQTPKYIDNAYN